MADGGGARPWHAVWPAHVPVTREYPSVPAWWLLEHNLARFADRVAVRALDHETLCEGRTLTYGELFRAARGVAAGLHKLGVTPGDRVGLCLPNSPELVVSYYAAWMAGAIAVPANAAAREAELAEHFADADVSLIVAPGHGAAKEAASCLGVPFVGADDLRELEVTPPHAAHVPERPDEAIAVLLYTGGTTGTPKGAMLTHRNIVANTLQFAEWYAFEPGAEIAMGVIPMFHSGGMSGAMNVPLYAGATLLVMPRFSAPAVAGAVGRYRATRLFGVPTMFIALLNCEEGRRGDYSSLRACRTNAAALPPRVKSAFDGLVGREVLVEGYGLTETSPLTHANPVGRAKPGSIGIPIGDTDARIVDLETGEDVAPGAPGELLVRGPQVMCGYWRRPEETATVLCEGWLRTGDITTMDAEGYFAVVDRKKDLINSAGFKIWPREVEETIYEHDAVKLVAVVGIADGYRGEAVKACIVLKDDFRGGVHEADIAEFCKARLSTYKVPRVIEFRDELPTSGAGKVLRRLLRESRE
jgi:long-chain acyl-CoA synthetase